MNSVLNILVPQKGRNVLTERPPASEGTALSIQCRCNVSVSLEKMTPSQIIQINGSSITFCNVVKNSSTPFSLFNPLEPEFPFKF